MYECPFSACTFFKVGFFFDTKTHHQSGTFYFDNTPSIQDILFQLLCYNGQFQSWVQHCSAANSICGV